MSAKHVLLGLLLDRPSHPYELGDRMQHRLGPAWQLNSGQLYQDVRWLKKNGLIARVQGAPGKDGRHVYEITAEGIAAFEQWLDEISDRPRLSRRSLPAQIALAGPERLEQVLARIEDSERQRVEMLGALVKMREEIDLERSPARAHDVLLHLSLSFDIAHVQADIETLGHARKMLSLLVENDVVWPFRHERSKRSRNTTEAERDNARKELFGELSRRGRPRPEGARGHR
jgi:DNA-binding PadR family transcriptional regulator